MYKYLKPTFDKILAIFLIACFSPIIIITYFMLLLKIGSPVIFTQMRPTKNGQIFKIYKFRTMSNEKNEFGELLPDEVRLKGFGKLIRSLSLDELPQLLNVLKGDISFIGPRPLLIEYLPLYSNFQNQRHLVKSGISGLAQIKGRNNLNWKNRFRYDVFYAKNISFKLDMYIILLTVWKVLKRSDVSQNGKVTADKFKG